MKSISLQRHRPILLFALATVLTGVLLSHAMHTPLDRWSKPRIYHEPFETSFTNQITLGRTAVTKSVIPSQRFKSSNDAYWYGVHQPDQTKQTPWNTRILIYNERGYLIDLTLKNVRTCKDIEWINEKLLKVRVWWGRIVATDLILDVEKEEFIYREMVHSGGIAYQQQLEFIEQGSGKE